jgi:hypothetical protein
MVRPGEDARTYSVEGMPPDNAEAVAPGLEKGPYVAETYPVTIEQAYVLVEI